MLNTLGASASGIVIALAACPYYALCLIIYLPIATFFMNRFTKVIIGGVMDKFEINA